MAQQELEAAVRRDGDQEAREIWQKVEAEAERIRRETVQAIALQQQTAAGRREVEIAARHEALLSAARQQAQSCLLTAEDSLAQHLKSLATDLLQEMALAGGPPLFQALSAEIPDIPWQRITLNPRDESAARKAYPTAELEFCAGISAGLEAASADRSILISNTLEKRLERLWPLLLPELLNELRPSAGDDETVA